MFCPLICSLSLPLFFSPSICMIEAYFWQWAPETQFLPCRYPAASLTPRSICHFQSPCLFPCVHLLPISLCSLSCPVQHPSSWMTDHWPRLPARVECVLQTSTWRHHSCSSHPTAPLSIFILGHFLHSLRGGSVMPFVVWIALNSHPPYLPTPSLPYPCHCIRRLSLLPALIFSLFFTPLFCQAGTVPWNLSQERCFEGVNMEV